MITAIDAIAILTFLKEEDGRFGAHLAQVCGVDSHEREFICDRFLEMTKRLIIMQAAQEDICGGES